MRRPFCLALIFCGMAFTGARGDSPYVAARSGKGELKFINGLPVLIVAGTPDEMGQQIGKLTAPAMRRMLTFPREYLKSHGFESAWPALVAAGKSMAPQFPPDHLTELKSACRAAGVDLDLAIVGNTFPDIKKAAGCSTLIVAPRHSATRGPLFGRNLDYPTLGFLHEYSLVTVYRPAGKHAFASVGFPGYAGVLSGINDAGLAVAILEVRTANDNSKSFDPKGVPYGLCYRRVLEECTTVAEAEKLLRSLRRTTRNNLAVCDPKGGAVFEITPKSLQVRRSDDGFLPCTNHFRTKELATKTTCPRYDALEKCKSFERLDVPDMMKLLNAANQGDLTLQTMIFEPAALKLHLSIGKCPTSARAPKLLELGPLFGKR